jgi:hypothetical protein
MMITMFDDVALDKIILDPFAVVAVVFLHQKRLKASFCCFGEIQALSGYLRCEEGSYVDLCLRPT